MANRLVTLHDVSTKTERTEVLDDEHADLKPGDKIVCPACKAVAYVISKPMFKFEILRAERVKRPDGTAVQPGEKVSCTSCGARYRGISISGRLVGRLDA